MVTNRQYAVFLLEVELGSYIGWRAMWESSATDLSQYYALHVYFNDGYTTNTYKYNSLSVRAVAAF